ncbi:MAG: CPBP family intramembrane metalloprotease [Candidatus Lokiarchaeota archaeon]|nr:CPBP family intramembrane metalloprotease [Candidatus Lokiarchaeota archaeon]
MQKDLKNTKNEEDQSSPYIKRAYIFVEIMIILLCTLFINLILSMLVPFDTASGHIVEVVVIYYLIPTLSVILGTWIGLYIVNFIFKSSDVISSSQEIHPIKEVFSTFKVTKNNLKYQFMNTLLLLFLLFIPLDFIAYSIPGVLDFSINSLVGSNSQVFLSEETYVTFISSALIVYLCVGLKEEFFFRAVSIQRGKHHIGKYSSIFLFSIAFGLSHVAYIITSDNLLADFIPALIWGLSAFIIGLIAGVFMIKRRWLIPLIIAHWLNNVISASALWLYNQQSLTFGRISLILYLPFLIVGVVLAILFRKHIAVEYKPYKQIFKKYAEESGPNKTGLVLTDIGVGFLIFLIAIMFL